VSEQRGTTIFPDLLHHKLLKQQNTQQFNLLQVRMFLFQTVYSSDVRQQVMVVRYLVPVQFSVCLLSLPLSFHAAQAVNMEAPFTSPIQIVVKLFCIKCVVVIVSQHTQVVVRMVSLRTYMFKIPLQTRITSIIHQFHVV
jgi:hypothetical protein